MFILKLLLKSIWMSYHRNIKWWLWPHAVVVALITLPPHLATGHDQPVKDREIAQGVTWHNYLGYFFTVYYCDMSKKIWSVVYGNLTFDTVLAFLIQMCALFQQIVTKLCIILKVSLLVLPKLVWHIFNPYSCIHFHSKWPTFTVLALCHTYAVSLYTNMVYIL